jgi:hypothetical protein
MVEGAEKGGESCPKMAGRKAIHPPRILHAGRDAVSSLSPLPYPMTLSPKLAKLLNEQINNEMSSSYVYLAMSAWF